MAKTIRNLYDKKLTYENLYKAHILSRKGKKTREETIKFNLKQEEYIYTSYACIKNKWRKKGLTIGNYTSQIYANIYLNEVDQYIKHKLKVKYYFRYMDDSIILINGIQQISRLLL